MRPRLFGSSGIRGVVNKEITTLMSQKIGQALTTMYPRGKIVVGRDVRYSGVMLEAALCSGIVLGGGDAFKAGLVPTPVTAWMIGHSKYDAGVEITASHNPSEYNGLKIFNEKGMSLTLKEQKNLEKILEDNSYTISRWDEFGSITKINAIDKYVNEISENVNINKKWKVSLDLFNGATCTVAPKIFKQISNETLFINSVPDGKFLTGTPEPTKKTLQRLGDFMKGMKSEIGFGFDGDGDRVMILDSKGELISPDRLLAAYAGYSAEQNKGGVVITHVGASMNVEEMVKKEGGKVIRTPVGDAFITEAMLKHNAVFGGEPVGAWVHPDINMCPDGILTALRILEALEEKEMTLEDFVFEAPEYPIDRAKIQCPNDIKLVAMDAISDNYHNYFNNVESIHKIDGVRFKLEQGWVLIRPSGTEPIIRITVEGKTKIDVKRYMEKGKSLIKYILGKIK
jgi:phosphoglucosamine mutase